MEIREYSKSDEEEKLIQMIKMKKDEDTPMITCQKNTKAPSKTL